MKTEYNALMYSMIDNLVVATIKICSGMIYSSNCLLSDGLHTMSDFITDVIALIGSLISKRRANKKHPFGYGNVQYIANSFIGIVLFILGIFIFINSFNENVNIPSLSILIILLLAIILKLISCLYLLYLGKKINSQILITSSKESFIDIYSTIGAFGIIILLQFSDRFPILEYLEMLYSVIISFLVIKMAINLIKDNVSSLIGRTDNNIEIIERVKEVIAEIHGVKVVEIELISLGSYYSANILVSVPRFMTVSKLIKLEKRIVSKVKKAKLKIKYVNVDVTV